MNLLIILWSVFSLLTGLSFGIYLSYRFISNDVWYSVDDFKPPSKTDVNVYSESRGVFTAYYEGKLNKWSDGNSYFNDVVKWTPLPVAPRK